MPPSIANVRRVPERWGVSGRAARGIGLAITGLASDEGSFSTGAVYALSGGRATY